ncbi:MAG: LysR family transcriptional regulator [Eggerthella lenta]
MTLQQLRYLIAIAEYGSINAAAQNLYASQSNLSTAIKSLSRSWASPCSRAATAA